MSLRLPYLVMSVLAHMVVCVCVSCFGVNDCFCVVVTIVACLGPAGSLPLAFSDVNVGIISTLIFLKNPSALVGFVIGVFRNRTRDLMISR